MLSIKDDSLIILPVGSGESGKSTVLKQLKIVHKITMTPDEIKLASESLKSNAAECMQILIEQIAVFGYSFDSEEHKSIATAVTQYDLSSNSITGELAQSIGKLWKSQAIQKAYARKTEFWILDSAD